MKLSKKLNKIEYLDLFTDLFEFKSIFDENGCEYIVYKSSSLDKISNIGDKTQFEAVENHVHLFDKISRRERKKLIPSAKKLGSLLMFCLKKNYPQKQFYVYVSICVNESMIIRFHQKWDNQAPYLSPELDLNENSTILFFEG